MNKYEFVMSEFAEISKIPRPSNHEEKIAQYLYNWAVKHGFKVDKDDLGQIIIETPASTGYETCPTLILQAHMDMVCVCDCGKEYDPLTDGITVIQEDGYIKADGTSLGADDGIGIAIALSMLCDSSLKHGPIKALFTVNEENGMDSINTDPKYIQGEYLVNLDWETTGSLCNSCAGGEFITLSRKTKYENTPTSDIAIEIEIAKLTGGHSGTDIDKGRISALYFLSGALETLKCENIDFNVSVFEAGHAINAIPQHGKAVIVVKKSIATKTEQVLKTYIKSFESMYRPLERKFIAKLNTIEELPPAIMSREDSTKLSELLRISPNGVISRSRYHSGLVESSCNIGIVRADYETVCLKAFARSSVKSTADFIRNEYRRISEQIGYDFCPSERMPGWEENPNSKLVQIACEAYRKITGEAMRVEPIHAGVECGVFAEKNPKLDIISIGPTTKNVHTPNEMCSLDGIKITIDLLEEIIKSIY